MRASLAVRLVAGGDPRVDTIAATAQGTLAAPDVELAEEVMTSRRGSAADLYERLTGHLAPPRP